MQSDIILEAADTSDPGHAQFRLTAMQQRISQNLLHLYMLAHL